MVLKWTVVEQFLEEQFTPQRALLINCNEKKTDIT